MEGDEEEDGAEVDDKVNKEKTREFCGVHFSQS